MSPERLSLCVLSKAAPAQAQGSVCSFLPQTTWGSCLSCPRLLPLFCRCWVSLGSGPAVGLSPNALFRDTCPLLSSGSWPTRDWVTGAPTPHVPASPPVLCRGPSELQPCPPFPSYLPAGPLWEGLCAGSPQAQASAHSLKQAASQLPKEQPGMAGWVAARKSHSPSLPGLILPCLSDPWRSPGETAQHGLVPGNPCPRPPGDKGLGVPQGPPQRLSSGKWPRHPDSLPGFSL